ncbi:hypothetical protein Q4567_06340 [Aliiglaciecola sp. 2_MG-2023]|uniref:Pepco domain-containing protein n=1 Tax=unclassified Aliiglaciecola TaxID=2593648 RepID=UPI0026E13BDB|nr:MULTISPECIES: hypothetical protein [unclassified Aliiglaciecola]MDO6710331.1 hypothetical protein [Aliiglaciecola sp. 2_MG-2023]MDO6751478.1 hypothetical protein [Aliiglaciecola sp. 1_MG-2023]
MKKISVYSSKISVHSEDDLQHAIPSVKRAVETVTEVPTEIFTDNLNKQLKSVQEALAISTKESGVIVEKIKLKFVVDAKGGVHLFGELSAGVSASIEVELKPR